MERKMETAKFLVQTGNFDEIHVYIHGKKAVSVAESLAGNSCYAKISGMWVEAVDEDLVFVTLLPETAIVFAIAELRKLGFVGLPAQVWVGVQQGPCYEEIYPLTGVFEIPGAEPDGDVKMNKIKILNAWGSQGNEFYDPAAANNGGGYDQSYGGITVQVGDEHLYIEVDDTSCGEFGERYSIAVYAIERQMKWFIHFNQIDEQKECEKALRRWKKDKRSIAGVLEITLEGVEKLINAAWDAASIYADEEYWRKKLEFDEWQKRKEEEARKMWESPEYKAEMEELSRKFRESLKHQA